MTTRREQVLDAAISVLGEHGVRRITHRAVDAAAELPAGSTSNYFRTRDALIEAVVDRFTAREQATWEQVAAAVQPRTAPELARALATFAIGATGPHRTLTLARYAIFVEVAQHPVLQQRLAAAGRHLQSWGSRWLRGIGSTHPDQDARLVLDQLDGLILHQLAFPDPAFDPAAGLTVLLEALLSRR